MRNVHGHEGNPVNNEIVITADDPDQENGNASHRYELAPIAAPGASEVRHVLQFQHGPIKEVGVNGITNEALLAVVADRLRGFQTSKFGCRENALALTKIEEAQHWLHARTLERVTRGVEGTLEP